MKKLIVYLTLLVLAAAPALAREAVHYQGDNPSPGGPRSDIELEYDGMLFSTYGLSPYWTDFEVVNFEVPENGPYLIAEVRYYAKGTQNMTSSLSSGGGLSSPPTGVMYNGPTFNPGYGSFPPGDWTNVDWSGENYTVNSGDIVRPGVEMFYTDFGIGLAYAFGDANPGHSWALWSGFWTDDTYDYGYDAGIRLGLNYGISNPVEETTWGAVKHLFN